MKKTLTLTLIVSLVLFGFGNFIIDAQGVNSEIRPGELNRDTENKLTYQQIYQGAQDIVDVNKKQAAQIKILLNEYFNEREELISNLDYQQAELRQMILTNAVNQDNQVINEEIVNTNNQLVTLRNEYLRKLRDVLNEEQVETILANNYVVSIGEQTEVYDNTQVASNVYPISGLGGYNRFSSQDALQNFQCGINYLQRSY